MFTKPPPHAPAATPAPVPAPAPVQVGDVLAGKYEVERVLGVGGMGVVVAAKHLALRGRVALKFLLPELSRDGEVVARFLREAQAATRIAGEHVARVVDLGTLESGAPYMVMEYLEGEDLAALVERSGALPASTAVDYVLQAMEAIAQAHAAGIVHRDLKPSNLFLTRRADGSALVKVLDFGISKAVGLEGGDAALTKTQGAMGTPMYMPPEQIRSAKHVDARSDVWSLGVILYELVSGRLPFDGEAASGVMAAILVDAHVPLAEVRPDAPAGLSEVVDRCLAKKPDDRFPSAGALAAALAPFGGADARTSHERIARIACKTPAPLVSAPALAAQVVAVTAAAWDNDTPAPRRERRWFAMGVAASVVIGVAVGSLLLRAPSSPAPAPASAATTGASSAAIAVEAPVVTAQPSSESAPPPAPAAASASASASSAAAAARPKRPPASPSAAPRPEPSAAPKDDMSTLIKDRH